LLNIESPETNPTNSTRNKNIVIEKATISSTR